jgi:ATP-dependent Clp protease ATP-binding subunit ClpB
VQRAVENQIARAILAGTIRDGDHVKIDAQDGKLKLTAVPHDYAKAGAE